MAPGDRVRYEGRDYIVFKVDGATLTLTNDDESEFVGVQESQLGDPVAPGPADPPQEVAPVATWQITLSGQTADKPIDPDELEAVARKYAAEQLSIGFANAQLTHQEGTKARAVSFARADVEGAKSAK